MSNNKNGPDNDDVGYGKPPKKHQFRKGQSGNPKGRPKKKNPVSETSSFKELIEKKLATLIPVLSNGESTTMTILGALVERLVNDALKGDLASLKKLLDLLREFGLLNPPGHKKKRLIFEFTGTCTNCDKDLTKDDTLGNDGCDS